MVGLIPIEKDVIPMVLLVNMHLIKGTLIIFPRDLAGYRAISDGPLVPANGTIGTSNRKGCHSNGSIGEYASH